MLAETYRGLLTDGPHWMFELTVELVTGILLAPLARWAWRAGLRRHDAVAHPEPKPEHRGLGPWIEFDEGEG